MKGYETWSMRDRSFLKALAISVVWHVCWFLAIRITISPEASRPKQQPKIVSLGRVLDDSIFRTLVETRPELSQTFYRQMADFGPTLEPVSQTIERRAPGEVVSLPFGQRFLQSVKVLVAGGKASPEQELVMRLPLRYGEEIEGLEGDVRDRELVSMPEDAPVPARLGARLQDVVIEFTVDRTGSVRHAEIASSSGDAGLDDRWLDYLRKWRFSETAGLAEENGRIRFRVSPKTEEGPR